MRIFWKKRENRLSVGFASGGLEARGPPTPPSPPPPLHVTSPELTAVCSAFASYACLHLFFTSNFVVFVDGGRNNISCPRAQGIP